MPFSSQEQIIIREIASLDQEEMISQIKEISIAAWDGALEALSVRSWLTNFSGEYLGNTNAECILALWILENYVYYTDRDVRAMTKNMWWKYLHFLLEEYEKDGFLAGSSFPEKVSYITEKTIIQPLGNCSGSGTNVAYFFRQTNRLDSSRFDLLNAEDYDYLVLVDDATLSGHQAKENLSRFDTIKDKRKIILTYISTERAKTYLGNNVTMLSSIDLDDRSRCFDDNSYVFRTYPEWKPIAKKMCEHYGQKLDPRNPIGYRNGQFTFGFYYNIPNNSLPIFWGTLGGWVPLFTRYFGSEHNWEEADNEKFL